MTTHLLQISFRNAFRVCDKFKLGPFTFNVKKSELEIVKSKTRIHHWYFQTATVLINIVMIRNFLLVQFFSKQTPYGIPLNIITLILSCVLIPIFSLNLFLSTKLDLVVYFTNNFLQMDKKLKSKF